MADEVAAELRRMVLAGELAPGQRVTQEGLAKELGVSTMPVREALLRLTHEGMIIGEPNRSFAVASNSEDDLRDMFWLYSTLCAELARRAAQHVTPELISTLETLHRRHVEHIDDPDLRLDATWQFFRAVNLASKSQRLALMLQLTLRYFPQIMQATPNSPALASRWQNDLIRALAKGDATKAESVSRHYATLVGEDYVASIRATRTN